LSQETHFSDLDWQLNYHKSFLFRSNYGFYSVTYLNTNECPIELALIGSQLLYALTSSMDIHKTLQACKKGLAQNII